jgi:hypothetical protein
VFGRDMMPPGRGLQTCYPTKHPGKDCGSACNE